jgi:hypothetical protein
MRRLLGPLAPLVFNPSGHLSCPAPIVRARAALAATQPVRALRPQALHTKLAAVAAVTAAVNLPLGIVREHTEKFSWQWIVAVHASIPFVAMLRKAIIMPKYAILFTIAAAVAGQAVGARLERKRLAAVAAATTAAMAVTAAPASATSTNVCWSVDSDFAVAHSSALPLALASISSSSGSCGAGGERRTLGRGLARARARAAPAGAALPTQRTGDHREEDGEALAFGLGRVMWGTAPSVMSPMPTVQCSC